MAAYATIKDSPVAFSPGRFGWRRSDEQNNPVGELLRQNVACVFLVVNYEPFCPVLSHMKFEQFVRLHLEKKQHELVLDSPCQLCQRSWVWLLSNVNRRSFMTGKVFRWFEKVAPCWRSLKFERPNCGRPRHNWTFKWRTSRTLRCVQRRCSTSSQTLRGDVLPGQCPSWKFLCVGWEVAMRQQDTRTPLQGKTNASVAGNHLQAARAETVHTSFMLKIWIEIWIFLNVYYIYMSNKFVWFEFLGLWRQNIQIFGSLNFRLHFTK